MFNLSDMSSLKNKIKNSPSVGAAAIFVAATWGHCDHDDQVQAGASVLAGNLSKEWK